MPLSSRRLLRQKISVIRLEAEGAIQQVENAVFDIESEDASRIIN